MSRAPGKGANGEARLEAVRDAAVAKAAASPLPVHHVAASGLVLPTGAVQKSRFPYLQHFAARGKLAADRKSMAEYEVRLGIVLGMKAGRELTLSFSPGMPARALAALLEQTSTRLREWADDCDLEGSDPRDLPAAEGATPPAGAAAGGSGPDGGDRGAGAAPAPGGREPDEQP